MSFPRVRVFLVYTQDSRFPIAPVQMDYVYFSEEKARKRAAKLNDEWTVSGVSHTVRHTNVVPLLLKDFGKSKPEGQ